MFLAHGKGALCLMGFADGLWGFVFSHELTVNPQFPVVPALHSHQVQQHTLCRVWVLTYYIGAK
jgi:hypothetical protein